LAQGNNFGIGLEGAGTNNNVVEENTILGNSNGLFLAAAVLGNVIRGNLITGNPSVQVSTDNPSGSGLDIKNLTPAGANAFVGNTCVTAVNAPCPSVGPSLTASPNPIPVAAGAIGGQTTLSWNAPDAQFIEIHLNSPNGQLFTYMGNRGSIQTGPWVADGTTFYLQDVTGENPRTADYTLTTLVVHLQATSANGVIPPRFWDQTPWWPAGIVAALIALCLSWSTGRRWSRLTKVVSAALLLAVLLYSIVIRASAQSDPTAQASAKIDRTVATHKGQQELAQYRVRDSGL
jgi:parallel beta-helix repeat protein